jgi:hypothetical protein
MEACRERIKNLNREISNELEKITDVKERYTLALENIIENDYNNEVKLIRYYRDHLFIRAPSEILYDFVMLDKTDPIMFQVIYEKYKCDHILSYCIRTNLDIAKHFIEKYNMNINCVLKDGRSLLIEAIQAGANIKPFIDLGCDINYVDPHGYNALYWAQKYNRTQNDINLLK